MIAVQSSFQTANAYPVGKWCEMTIAELHGKLSGTDAAKCHDRMEDLLTSDVFGTMQYVGWEHGFLKWLHGAKFAGLIGTDQIAELIPLANLESIHFAFWPRLPNQREPDVVLLFEYSSSCSLLLVEAKYFSGTSDFETEEDVDHFGRTGNQIADQINGLASVSDEWVRSTMTVNELAPIKHRIHLFVTANVMFPSPVYREAAKHTGPGNVSAFWLSWTFLCEFLETELAEIDDVGRAAQIVDLVRLLNRKGLVPFRGFRGDISWERPAELGTFWQRRWWQQAELTLANTNGFWRSENG